MANLQMNMGYSLIYRFLVFSFFLKVLCAVPLNHEEISDQSTCTLRRSYFLQPQLKKNIFSLAEEAQMLDKDTDNKIFGNNLFFNIMDEDYCSLMREVTSCVMENVLLTDVRKTFHHTEDAIIFFGNIMRELAGCKVEEKQIKSNVEEMKNKIKMLGPEGQIKVIGELDLLFGHLRKCAFQKPNFFLHYNLNK
ncbi:interleukin-22 [Pelobates fuscus]|uniref:interleukin-22 n=1 Tax=Pelobates fuscus TaxID=191477 RepID=UPI002FE4B40A